ncbi:hypothetical protein LCGC14_1579810 [marine sediment metagenome]|uniref:Uncharacterized protein n=1 Tax=marine sediment metagenome TaxID=412755 RepID=A0A0F9IHC3_9ZZZZ
MIDIKIKNAKISKNSKQMDLDGVDISYVIDNRNLWNIISLTKVDALKLAHKILAFFE